MRELHSERLRIRPPLRSDAAFIMRLMNDGGYLANIGERGVRTIDDAEAYLRTAPIYSDDMGLGFNIVELNASGERVGICGLVKRPEYEGPDLGYAFLDTHCGRGLASEASACVLAHALDDLNLATVLGKTTMQNLASRRVLEKLGMTLEQTDDQGTCLYRISKDDVGASTIGSVGTDGSGRSDKQAIDALAADFYAAFDNRSGRVPDEQRLRSYFTMDASIWRVVSGKPEKLDPSQFIEPRISLLTGNSLSEFHEWEVAGDTLCLGNIASRWSLYEKSGVIEGEPFRGGGRKLLQLCRQQDGSWKITAMLWEDDAPVSS